MSSPITVSATKLALLQSKFHRIIKHRIKSALKPFDLKTVDWVVLGFINHKKKPMGISEVAFELGIQSAFMTVIVAKLAKKSLITVTNDKIDHRKKYIVLTKEGAKVIRLMQRQFEEFFVPFTRGLTAKDIETYLKIITTVIKNFENQGWRAGKDAGW
ncbi:MAG TPA: winged helix DNA-binding protein [Candidatus Paceibacterota bacterium]|nr:winged helix DNA-binding protein [Candidatus Paceibacterota bacterium]